MTDENQVSLFKENDLPQVVEQQETNPIMAMIQQATAMSEVDTGKMQALMDMYYKDEDRRASKEFLSDFSMMQGELPSVPKLADGHNCKYATYDGVKQLVQPYMKKYGFGDSYDFEYEGDVIFVITTISHKSGHMRATKARLPYDKGGSKNAVQAVGSSMSYGKRYGLIAALGLSTCDDDDGNSASEFVTREQFLWIDKALEETKSDKQAFIQKFKFSSVQDIPSAKFKEVENALLTKAKSVNVTLEKFNAGN